MKNSIFIIALILALTSQFVLGQNKFAFYQNNNLYLSSLDGEISHLGSDIKIKKDKLIETSRYFSYSFMPIDVLESMELSEGMGFSSALQSMDDENLWIFVEINMQNTSYNLCFYNRQSKTKSFIFSQDKSPDSNYAFIPFVWTKDIVYLEAKIFGSATQNEGIWSYNITTKQFSKLPISPSYLITPVISPDRKNFIYVGTTDTKKDLESPLNVVYVYDLINNKEKTVVKDNNASFYIFGWIDGNIEKSDVININEEESSLKKKVTTYHCSRNLLSNCLGVSMNPNVFQDLNKKYHLDNQVKA